ncbi:MAG TPA: hypothetical protein VIU63_03310 [Nitrospira sp.]
MEAARKLDHPPTWDRPASDVPKSPEPARIFGESGLEIQPWEIKLGKMIFYVTVALGLWFFYWLNGCGVVCLPNGNGISLEEW